ncbi:4'-phosphopantetheinyl transferase superfamily protein [Salicibibacter cibi]|uniref:4'-phosphopantetheinyl transferase superfamily protein n=1 Tax=Salicibibacter cibi TaxID=2743001 RepID=A0A7T6ZDQ8_9BACI|nr:4'-phosphopantetheinyl transferase superfamily protein [Salicibibacter cibi]QQK81517.1 4'-phosphopantetheinyl transferase superfamily protein [Salicibibacter cibi]
MTIELYTCSFPRHYSQHHLSITVDKLPKISQEKIKRFHYLEDAYRSALGETLVLHLLEKKYGATVRKGIRKEITEYGKPYFPQYPLFHYNQSHAGEWVACGLYHQEIGVDVECIQPIDKNILKSCFTSSERSFIFHADDSDAAACQVWSMKESYVKAEGRGLFLPVDSFEVLPTGEGYFMVQQKSDTGRDQEAYGCSYPLQEGYQLSVCALGAVRSDFPSTVIFQDIEHIC